MGFSGKNRKWRFISHPDICGLCNPIDNLFSKFNSTTFNDLKQLQENVKKIQSSMKYLKEAAGKRVRQDTPEDHCIHLGEDGYCTHWGWDSWVSGKDIKQDKNGRWHENMRTNPLVCVACPSYETARIQEALKQIPTLTTSIQEIWKEILDLTKLFNLMIERAKNVKIHHWQT